MNVAGSGTGRLKRPFAWYALPIITIYSRPECPLCQHAERAIRRIVGRRNVRVIDITLEKELEDIFVFRVPVVQVGDEIIAEGDIGEAALQHVRAALRNVRANGESNA